MKAESRRLFENSFMELMSKVHWTVPLYIYIPVILYFLYKSFFVDNIVVRETFLLYLGGILFWTLLEYLLHRFAFHYEAKTEFGKRLVFIFHGIHHEYPLDRLRLVMPPSVSLPLGILFYSFFYFTVGVDFASPMFAGTVTGYLVYDMTHFAIHHFAIENKFLMKIKTNHMKHHYKDSGKGFGVSSPFWDHVFQTDSKS